MEGAPVSLGKQQFIAEGLTRKGPTVMPSDEWFEGKIGTVFILLAHESGSLNVSEIAYAADESKLAKRAIREINLQLPKKELEVEQNRADMSRNGMIETGVSLGVAAVEAGTGVALIASGAGTAVGVVLVVSAAAKIVNKVAGVSGAYDWVGKTLKPEADASDQRALGNKIQQVVTYGELGLSLATLPLAGSSAIAEGAKWVFKMETATQVFGGIGYSYFGIIRSSDLKGKEQNLQAVILDMTGDRTLMENLQQGATIAIQESGKGQVDTMKAAQKVLTTTGKTEVYQTIAAAAA